MCGLRVGVRAVFFWKSLRENHTAHAHRSPCCTSRTNCPTWHRAAFSACIIAPTLVRRSIARLSLLRICKDPALYVNTSPAEHILAPRGLTGDVVHLGLGDEQRIRGPGVSWCVIGALFAIDGSFALPRPDAVNGFAHVALRFERLRGSPRLSARTCMCSLGRSCWFSLAD